MRKVWILSLVLTASICFNLFFIAGAVFSPVRMHHRMPPPPGHRGDIMMERMGLTPEERSNFRHIFERFAPRPGREDMDPGKMHLVWEELIQDKPDMIKVDRLLSEIEDSHHNVMRSMQLEIGAYLRTLPMKRRRQIVEEFFRDMPMAPRFQV